MASNKMPRRLVALSSSAIAAIYFAGLVTTHGADASLGTAVAATAATNTPAIVATSTVPASPVSVAPTDTTAIVTSTSAPTATTSPATTGAYVDGSYTGTGTSRRGSITVTVTVSGGRIANVALTSVNTEYPGSRISALPAQVVARQSANVDNVSGATYSAQAFRLAVQAALAKAAA